MTKPSSALAVTPAGRFPIVRDGEHPLRTALEQWRERAASTGADTSPEAMAHDESLHAAQAATAAELIAAQEALGVDLLGDGYVPLYDEWFAWAPAIQGVRVENAIRYLDTNTYYHRWRLDPRPGRRRPGPAVEAYRLAATLTTKPVKPCLFGPYTLWTYAIKDGDSAGVATFDALVEIWAAEVADLAAAGARDVQLDESVLLRPQHRAGFPLVARAIRRIVTAAPAVRLILHLACGEAGDLLEPLLDLPAGGIGLDFTGTYRAANLAALRRLRRWPAEKTLQAGMVDAREIRIETAAALCAALDDLAAVVPPDHCLATPSTALLYLPRHAAFAKLAALVQAAHLAGSRLVPAVTA